MGFFNSSTHFLSSKAGIPSRPGEELGASWRIDAAMSSSEKSKVSRPLGPGSPKRFSISISPEGSLNTDSNCTFSCSLVP